MKKFLLPILLSFVVFNLNAQEESIFSHYTINPVLVNPAAAGFDESAHNIFLNLRAAYTGFPGSPKTYSVNYNGPVGNNLGLGALLYSENIAGLTRYRAQLSYAVRFKAGDDYKFGVGLSTELHRSRLNGDPVSNNPDLYDLGDVLLNQLQSGENEFDASIGGYGSYKDNIFFGLSFPNLVRSRLDRIAEINTSFNFIANVGANFFVNNNSIKINPSILVKQARNSPLFTDLNLLASFLDEQLITGVQYRVGGNGNFGLTIGTKYNAIRFLYSYELNMGPFSAYHNGTHEISINFMIDRGDGIYDRSKKFRDE